MNRTCGNDARGTSALTNRKDSVPNYQFTAFNINSSTSSHVYFNTSKPPSIFLAEYQWYEKAAGHLGGDGVRIPCPLPLDPPLHRKQKENRLNQKNFLKYLIPCQVITKPGYLKS